MDISSKQSEKTLQTSKIGYRPLFDNNRTVMLLLDPENANIVDANNAACNFYGWSHEEITSKKIFEINTLPQEEMIAEMEKAKNEAQNHFFLKHRLASGDIRDVEVYTIPIQIEAKKMLCSIISDITKNNQIQDELTRSQIKYRLLSDTTFEGIIIHDNGIALEINKAVSHVTGYERDELLGKNILEITIHPDDI